MGRLQKFFSYSVGCRFALMIVSFAVQKLCCLIRSHLSVLVFVAIDFGVLVFVAIAFGVLVMKSLPIPMS